MQLSDTVSLTVEDQIALIRIDNPPVNAAGVSVRKGLVAAVDWLEAHPDVRAAGLYAAGRTFVAGADIREFGKPPLEPHLPDVCDRIEAAPVPIVAVLHGTTLGGGLEIAMACHRRVALDGLRVGLPEVLLGIMPGAGGTQRMPRLAGQAFAVDAITSGRQIPLSEALDAGLVDTPTDETDPEEAARQAAEAVAEGREPYRRTGELMVTPDPKALADARARIAAKQPHLFSPLKCVEAVEGATRPIAQGMSFERDLYFQCQASKQRGGLIHAFFAERATAKFPEAGAPPRAMDSLGVIGAGTMGAGIATAALLAGLDVTLTDRTDAALDRGRATIDKNLDGAVKRGKLADKAAAMSRLATTTDLSALAKSDIIVEAAFEDIAVKQAIFSDLDKIAKPGAVLATNTSYLDVNQIAGATARPSDVIGLHFFSPAHVMRLLEIVVTDDTAPDVVATGLKLAKALRKIPVRSGVCDGFIGNRILRSTRKAVEYMMLDGTSFAAIDDALEGAGWALGPFRTGDLAGLDIAWAQRKRLAETRPAQERYVSVPDVICEAGQFGRKTGAGYYMGDGTPNPVALEAIRAEQTEKGITPRSLSADQIVERFLTAMILEATLIVEEGIALRPIDVDAVMLFGYGFPRHLGGPLFQADQIGAKTLVERIESYAAEDAFFWQVPDVLHDMAHADTQFATRN